MLPFQTLQFESFRGSLVHVIAIHLIIETRSTDRTVAIMFALTRICAAPSGVGGAGVNGLVVPGVAMLPWSGIGVLYRGRWH